MRILALLLMTAAALPSGSTPRPEDVPKPGPVELGLAGEARPDILRYLYLRTAAQPSLSPDGRRLAFRTDITGQRQLWVVDAAGGWPRQLTFGPEGVTVFEWSPRGDWIFYASDRGGNEREGYYLISPDGARERELLPPSEDFRAFGGFSPDGRRIAYATTSQGGDTFDIHVLEVESGEDRLALAGRMGLFVSSWNPRGTALLLRQERGEDANDVFLLDLETGRLETLFQPREATFYGSFSWQPDGSGFYLVSNEGREFTGLAFYDLRSRALRWIETPDHEIDGAELHAQGRYLVWKSNEGGYTVLRARDLEQGRDLKIPRLPPGVLSLQWAEGAPVLALEVSGPQVPGDIWLWDVREAAAKRATHSALAGLDPETFVVPTHLDFPARDGVVLHGLLYLPRSLPRDVPAGTKPPVLLAVHGGPTSQARPDFDPVFQYLLARGIAIFDLNFRGSSGYGKTFTRLDNGRLRPNAVLDMGDALDFLARDGRVDAARAAVMGGSYGGYMAFAALTSLPERFRGGASFVGVSNWVTALEGTSPELRASDVLEYGDVSDPAEREFFRQISPITQVSRVKAPLMVVHGANDPRDPVAESDAFVEAVRRQGGKVEYLRFPDEGHNVRKLANRVIAFRRLAAFLEEVLGLAVSEGQKAGEP